MGCLCIYRWGLVTTRAGFQLRGREPLLRADNQNSRTSAIGAVCCGAGHQIFPGLSPEMLRMHLPTFLKLWDHVTYFDLKNVSKTEVHIGALRASGPDLLCSLFPAKVAVAASEQ